jgi:hypothetical protein
VKVDDKILVFNLKMKKMLNKRILNIIMMETDTIIHKLTAFDMAVYVFKNQIPSNVTTKFKNRYRHSYGENPQPCSSHLLGNLTDIFFMKC